MEILKSFAERWPQYKIRQDNQILCSTFRQDLNEETITLNLTSEYIAYQLPQQEDAFVVLLTPDLRFTMLFTNKQYSGIEFRYKDKQPLIVHSDTMEILGRWYGELSKVLYQYGFHKNYKTLKKIGKGAFSTVYLSERFMDRKVFAVKNFTKPNTKLKTPEQKWLLNELDIMKMFNHPSIVKLEAIFEETNNILAVIQYAQGKSLDKYCYLDPQQKLQPSEVLEVSKHLIDALIHMKQANVVHRDLKPQNIILRPGLKPIIIDFGFGINLTNIPEELRHACGTPGFIAPQIYKKEPLNFGSYNDVYSLGAIIYNLLYGPLHLGSSLKQIIDKNRASSVPRQLKYSDFPLDRLIYQMLEKDPKNRITIQDASNHEAFKVKKKSMTYLIDLLHS